MKRSVFCILLCILAFVSVQAQTGIFQKVIADSTFSKDYRFRSLPLYSLYTGLTNVVSPTTGTYDLTAPSGNTAQRPTVPAGKYILRYNTDSSALEIGNPSQVWKTLSMSSIQTLDTSSIPNFGLKVRSIFSATLPLQYNGVTGNLAIQQANSSQAGYLAQADWIAFNAKLPDPGSNGLLTRTSLGTLASRQLVAASSNISIVNPNGVAGNPSLDINDTLTLRQLVLPYLPAALTNADSALFLNRLTGMLEVRPVVAGIQTLQQTTSYGNETRDSIVVGGVITKHLLSDTLHEPDFEIDVFPDLQNMTQYYQAPLRSMFDYVVNNKTANNIVGLFQVGDLVNGTNPSVNFWEWDTVATQMYRVRASGIPHMMVIGNHDYDSDNVTTRGVTAYNTYFGPSYFTGQSYYGNNYNGSNENYYIKFNVGSHKYLALGIEFLPRDNALNWAGRVVDSFPDREVIVVTHAYITHWNERSVDTSDFSVNTYSMSNSNSGQAIWDKFIKKHKNIFMVLSGHYIRVGKLWPSVGNIKDIGDSGNVVHNFVVNYQKDTLGGNGYFMRMKFSPKNATVNVDFYSPYLNQTDWREPSYTFNYPSLNANTTVGVNGDFVTRDLRVKGVPKFEKLRSNAIAYVWNDHEIRSDSTMLYDDSSGYRTLKIMSGTKVSVRDSAYIKKLQNDTSIVSVSNTDSLYVRKEIITGLLAGGIGATDTLKFAPTTYGAANGFIKIGSSLTGGASYWDASNNAILIGTNSYSADLTITKSKQGNLGIFIKNTDAVTNGANERIALRNDANETSQFTQYNSSSVGFGNGARSVLISSGAANGLKIVSAAGGPIVFGSDNTVTFGEQMKLFTSTGNFMINSSTDQNARLYVGGTIKITDTLKTPNIVSQVDTTLLKPEVVDASGNHFKMSNWPNTSPIQTLQNFITGISNTSTTETDLFSYTIPANKLVADGDKITFDVTGQFFDPTANVEAKFYFGGNILYSSTAMTVSSTGSWTARIIVIRTGTTTAKASIVFSARNATGFDTEKYISLSSLDFTTTNIIKVTGTSSGTGGGSGDISADMGYVQYVK